MDLQQTIIRNVITNDPYMRKVLPFLDPKYFEGANRLAFREVGRFVAKYNKLPNHEQFVIELQNSDKLTDEQFDQLTEIIPALFDKQEDVDEQWLLDVTEKWCQDRALYNAIMESIAIIDGKHKELTKNALPEILSKALGISFDSNVGHNYLADAAARHDFYNADEEKIAFDLELLNKITSGGIVRKTLTVLLAGTGVGKSLAMCHMAAANLSMGLNVLYITMEMSEERIAERIDANLLDTPINQLKDIPKPLFVDRVNSLKGKTQGKLVIKEYPTGQANSAHFRALLNDLKLKQQFVPDIIYIDYLNICASARMKSMGGTINSYTYIKAIAEELRGLAIEFDLPVVSATQVNRTGFGNSDPDLEHTSESFGLPATADLMLALVSSEELEAEHKIMIKQLKNRYNDINYFKRFVVGIDRPKMRLFDCNQEDGDVLDDTPLFDKSNTGKRLDDEKFIDFKIE